MSYADTLARLKKMENGGTTEPTQPTEGACVGSVGSGNRVFDGNNPTDQSDEPTSVGSVGSPKGVSEQKHITPSAPSNDDKSPSETGSEAANDRPADQALLRTLGRVVDDLPLTAHEVYAELSDGDIAAWQHDRIETNHLRDFAVALYDGRERKAGRIPESYQYVATCRHCGPVWLTIPGHVPSCPWCINRYNGWPIPRPKPVTCATCRHFKRRNHAHLGDCGAGIRPYAAAGFWDTDSHACNRWLTNDKESGRN